jgi:hypothetical protein
VNVGDQLEVSLNFLSTWIETLILIENKP